MAKHRFHHEGSSTGKGVVRLGRFTIKRAVTWPSRKRSQTPQVSPLLSELRLFFLL
jgi:hypothetical protein